MCLSPISIPTRSRVISSMFNEKMFVDVPCNNCDECNDAKQREWQFRFYYEAQRSDYVYYDTLTYDDAHLPHVADFYDTDVDQSCFSRDDVQKFLKRLRRKLQYHFAVNEDAFKYFIASEYGTSEYTIGRNGRVYYNTHRPHYHILLFVHAPIEPLVLSRYVGDCWQCGRTDGLPYKSRYYVQDHNILKKSSVKLTNYVAKYICKQSSFTKKIEPIIFKLRDGLDRSKYVNYSSYKKDYRKIARTLRQFHLQSHHLGESFLYGCCPDSLALEPFVKLNLNNFILSIPLPLYYVRKLFYRLESYKLNDYVRLSSYVPNHLGLVYLEFRYQQKVDLVKVKLQNMIRKTSYELHDSLDSFASYIVDERCSNQQPYLHLSLAEKLNFPYYLHLYGDSDIDLNGKPMLLYSEDNSQTPPLTYFRRHSYSNHLEPHLLELKKLYKNKVPDTKRLDFVTEFRNKHRFAQLN